MYKLFLTFRYLTRKAIVIFPVLVTWLCVMMMIIVTSIMGGFVERVRQANRELQGDIVIYNNAGGGWAHYDKVLKIINDHPDVEAATPVVQTFGLLNLPDHQFQKPVQVVGIDPVGRSKVSKFRETLYMEYQAPLNATEDLAKEGFPATGAQLDLRAQKQFNDAQKAWRDAEDDRAAAAKTPGSGLRPYLPWLWLPAFIPINIAYIFFYRRNRNTLPRLLATLTALVLSAIIFIPLLRSLTSHPKNQDHLSFYAERVEQSIHNTERAYRALLLTDRLDPHKTYHSREELQAALLPPQPNFDIPPAASQPFADPAKAPKYGAIVGADVGLYQRDRLGRYDRRVIYPKAVITIVPIAPRGTALTSRIASQSFSVIDDSYARVYDVDSVNVYVPFEVAQNMADMRSNYEPDDPNWSPPRCSEILIKLKDSSDPDHVERVRAEIETKIAALRKDLWLSENPKEHDYPLPSLLVQTWDQKQAKYINAVQNEKRMQIFILGLMSLVVLVVIFLIFYMIVRDKTRDIGIIKAVGGTETGVAAIFLLYGMLIGTVGGALGVITGVAFVTHTNEIHEFIRQVTGITIWDRSVYLFDRIPDTVNYTDVFWYFIAAVAAGALGALIPAIVAGLRNPTEAIRYE